MFSYEILTPAALNFFVNYADGAVGGDVLSGCGTATGIACPVALCKLLLRLHTTCLLCRATPATAGCLHNRECFLTGVLCPAYPTFSRQVESLWSIDQYFEFVLVLMLSTGLAFQVRPGCHGCSLVATWLAPASGA